MFARATIGGRRPLLQFRAGVMTISDGVATADPRGGICSLVQGSSGLLEVWWSPATSNNTANDTHVYLRRGDGTTVSLASKCPTGRVLALCLEGKTDANHTRLFWIQESNTDRDTALLKNFKELIGDRGDRGARAEATLSGGPSSRGGDRAAGSAGGGAAAARLGITTEMLGSIFSDLENGTQTGNNRDVASLFQQAPQAPLAAAASAAANGRRVDVDLRALLGSDAVLAAIRDDPGFYRNRLAGLLPSSTTTTTTVNEDDNSASAAVACASGDIAEEVRCPQAAAAAHMLQAAASETPEGFAEVTRTFNLNTNNNNNTGTIVGGGAIGLLEAVLRTPTDDAQAQPKQKEGDEEEQEEKPQPQPPQKDNDDDNAK